MKAKIAVIGDGDSVLCFAAAGAEPFDVTEETALATLKKLVTTHQIIFITEEYAKLCESFISKFDSAVYPAILPIPGKNGSTGMGLESLRAAGEKALGVDILFHKEES